MSEVFRVPISKAQLRAIPKDERNLLLLASHAVNQLSVMRKVLIFSLNYEGKNEIESTLSAGQSQTILRFLLGALAEGWEFVRRPTNQKLIGQKYLRLMSPEGRQSYAVLKKHFGSSNLLHKVRNTISFHYPDGPELDAAFTDVPENEDWAWYPSDTINNSFYLASDMVISTAIIRVTGESDIMKAFQKVMTAAVNVSNELVDFLLYLMRAIVERYIGIEVLSPRKGTGTKIVDPPDLYGVAIPFFTTRDESTIPLGTV